MSRRIRGLAAIPFLAGLFLVGLAFAVPAFAHGVFHPQTFSLKNGMQVVVIPNHRGPVVTQMVWYKVGAADEPPGKSGMAHFFEHLMFKGTTKYPDETFSRMVADNGGQDNAFTTQDYTAFFETVAKDRLGLMMTMEADRMRHLTLTQAQIDQERQVVLEERRMRTDNNPAARLQEQIDASLFMNSPYRKPVIGWAHEIRALTASDLKAFYDKWYHPNNAILVVAGDITAAELKPMAERTFGKIPPGPALDRHRPTEPKHITPVRMSYHDARVRQPSWSRTYLAPSMTQGDRKSVYALQVLVDMLSNGSTSPMYKALVINDKLAISAGAYYDGDGLGPGTLTIYASPRPGVSMKKLEDATNAQVKWFLASGLTKKALAKSIKHLVTDAIYARDSLGTGARVLGAALASGQTVDDVENWPDHIKAVTLHDLRLAAYTVFHQPGSVTAMLLPKKGVSQGPASGPSRGTVLGPNQGGTIR